MSKTAAVQIKINQKICKYCMPEQIGFESFRTSFINDTLADLILYSPQEGKNIVVVTGYIAVE